MPNKITEKYFTQQDFSQREKEVLKKVLAENGFKIDREIHRGILYDYNKVGSLIYRGLWQGKSAALKLQGLKPEIDESEIIKNFTAQNKSKIVRVPKLYAHMPWNEKDGYGYLITEYIDASKIFELPYATPEQMRDFARFYQEYRTSALTRSWISPEETDSFLFTVKRVEHWQKIQESKKILKLEDYAPYLLKYYPLAAKHFKTIPMVFCHGHLTANDIYKFSDGSFAVLSNLFWTYRPQWYDLAFNIWACIQHIKNNEYTFEEMLKYVDDWLKVYREIPVVKEDKDFERKITAMLLERLMGAILVDITANKFYQKKENSKYLYHFLGLQQKLFDHLAGKLEFFN